MNFDEEKEIEFLLHPELKRKKKELILNELKENIKILNNKFKLIFDYIKDFINDSEFFRL
jgi:hypothetical protein